MILQSHPFRGAGRACLDNYELPSSRIRDQGYLRRATSLVIWVDQAPLQHTGSCLIRSIIKIGHGCSGTLPRADRYFASARNMDIAAEALLDSRIYHSAARELWSVNESGRKSLSTKGQICRIIVGGMTASSHSKILNPSGLTQEDIVHSYQTCEMVLQLAMKW